MPAVNYDLVDYSTYKLFLKNITRRKISAPEILNVNSDVNRNAHRKFYWRDVNLFIFVHAQFRRGKMPNSVAIRHIRRDLKKKPRLYLGRSSAAVI
jgi:hypothetical protein